MKPRVYDSPIVEEVRRRRTAVLARFGYDLRKYGEELMARQKRGRKASCAQKRRRAARSQRPAGPRSRQTA